MNASHRRILPEEMELQQKLAELAALRARHAEVRVVLQRLRDEIASFESVYHQALGSRVAELDRIEAEISRRGGFARWEYPRQESAFSQAWQDSSRETGAAVNRSAPSKSAELELKALYREVAKTIHPDLAGPGLADTLRHELMAKANRAYAEDDRCTLQEILRNWRRLPDQGKGDGAIAGVIRQMARERQEIRAVSAKVAELKGSYVWRFKKRVAANLAMGVDLLADMVADTDLEIDRALRRLAALTDQKPQKSYEKKQKKSLSFPDGLGCGIVYLRDRASISYHDWKEGGVARGLLEVDVDRAVRLDIKERAGLSSLERLRPDDLHSLFLYGVGDADLDGISHLTGLEEVYLSGVRLTDGALSRLSLLRKLKRIYLYQTDISDRGLSHLLYLPDLRALTSSGNRITDEGLAAFRLATRGVKTVSFNWKR